MGGNSPMEHIVQPIPNWDTVSKQTMYRDITHSPGSPNLTRIWKRDFAGLLTCALTNLKKFGRRTSLEVGLGSFSSGSVAAVTRDARWRKTSRVELLYEI